MLNLLKKKDETETFDLTLDRHYLTGQEMPFPADELIVSKTDPVGIMTYVNDIFIQMSGYAEEELLGRLTRLFATLICRAVCISCFGKRLKVAARFLPMWSTAAKMATPTGFLRT